jgi:hypothetical protein
MTLAHLLIGVVALSAGAGSVHYDDAEVLGICLDQLQGRFIDLEKDGSRQAEIIFLYPESLEADFYVSDAQVCAELSEQEWAFAKVVLSSLRARSASASKLPPPNTAKFVLRPLDDDSKRKRPEARWVSFYLPGYSETQDQALVRGWFGPTAHGGTFTCAMEKGRSGWSVKWSRLSFYA